VEATRQDLCAVLEIDDPCAEVHPGTWKRYEQLAGEPVVELRERQRQIG
jgi:hypothetical protein